jgi:DNA-binding MarR family transcriptional regulator
LCLRNFLKDLVELIAEFEEESKKSALYQNDIQGFKDWIADTQMRSTEESEPDWEGKINGRSADSVISTFIVHMNRYGKSYSKAAIQGSDFSGQEDFIYLINLNSFGPMSKMDLIRKNVHEKPVGNQIINRLIKHGWVDQVESEKDKRSKLIFITIAGKDELEKHMGKIREATKIVSGDLTLSEKMTLIRLLNKLSVFHKEIYDKNIEGEDLLREGLKKQADS